MRVRSASVCLCALIGCGPIRSTSLIVDAQAELAAAENAQAMRVAPYEATAAAEYLHKAREEQSYAEFEVAEYLARKARDCAHFARLRADQAANAEMGGKTVGEMPSNKGCAPVYAEEEEGKIPLSEPKPKAAPKKAAEPKDPEPKDPMPEGDE